MTILRSSMCIHDSLWEWIMTNIRLLTAKLTTQITAVGFRGAVGHGVRHILGRAVKRLKPVRDDFDARYGTDTGGLINLWQYRIDSPNAKYGVSYGSASEQHIQALLSPFPRTASFVDLGCGKGRPLIVAATMGFKTIIGVEFVRELAEIARNNLRKTGTNATVVCADAVSYKYPPGPLIIYLYDPFGAAVMASVARNLKRHKEELWVIYINPEHSDLFDSWIQRLPLTPVQANLFLENSVVIWHRDASRC